MGEVYRAEQVFMKRQVALKVLRSEWARDAEMAARFQREAELASRLDHPNVVRVFDFGRTAEGQLYLAMELVVGRPLEALLSGPLPVAEAIGFARQLCDALEAAHGHGIVHRDLKPENVYVLDGPSGEQRLKVLDFGIARGLDSSVGGQVTRAGLVLGTPDYLSPEQALARDVDARTDLYSLSVMLYRMLAGRLPFVSDDPRKLLSLHLTAEPPPIAGLRPELGRYPGLAEAIGRGLEKDPERRWQTAGELGRALSECLSAAGPEPTAPAPPAEAPRAPPPTPPPSGPRAPSLRQRSQNLTVVFTDIQGFTARTAQQTREQTKRLLETHERLLLPVFAGYDGRVVKSIGDAFLVVFDSPTNALLCAMALQDRLAEHNRAAAPEDRLLVRVAANLGDVTVVKGDVFGDPVNLAARVEGVTEAGEICFTEAVYLAMNRSEIPHEPAGIHELKGIEQPVRLWRARKTQDGALPFGGVALEPLRERLQRQERFVEAKQQARRAVGEAAQQGMATLSRWIAPWLRLPPRARAASIGALSIVGGLILVEALPRHAPAPPPDPSGWRERAVPPEPAAPPEQSRDTRSLDEILAELAGHPSCLERRRDARRLGEIGDEKAVPALERIAHGRGGGLFEPLVCQQARHAAREALDRIDPGGARQRP